MSADTDPGRFPVIFQHIPKTAGVSARSVMSRNFASDRILHLPDRHWRDRGKAERVIRTHDFVHGHLHFEFVRPVLDRARVVTFLRDPVERVLSLYFFLRKHDINQMTQGHARRTVELAQQLDVDEFVGMRDPIVTPMVSDYQMRVLISGTQMCRPRREWLGEVLGNLRRYAFVGLCDRDVMAESISRMNATFGWPDSDDAPVVNATPRSASSPAMERAKGIIAERNPGDIALLQHVREEFRALPPVDSEAYRLTASVARRQGREDYRAGLDGLVSMQQAVRCWGWHDREWDGKGRCWRCGAQWNPGLELKVPSGAMALVFGLRAVHPRVAIARSRILAGRRACPSRAAVVNGRWLMVAWVDAGCAEADGMLRLEFALEENADPSLGGDTVADSRFVTIALESVEVVPAAAPTGRAAELLSVWASAPQAAQVSAEAEAELRKLRIDCARLQEARERERSEGAKYQASLVSRAERAEQYAQSLHQALTGAHEQMASMQAARVRELADGRHYAQSLVERAQRAEDYAASLVDALGRSRSPNTSAAAPGTPAPAQGEAARANDGGTGVDAGKVPGAGDGTASASTGE